MNVAVTGATGFVGRHVVRELQRLSCSPILLCRRDTAVPDALTGFQIATLDIHAAPPDAFERLGRPDVLIHLAWGGLPNYLSLHHFETELPAQYRFLKELVRAGLRHCVVTGTCFEYGFQSGELNEEVETRPSNPYGFAKDTLRRKLEFLRKQFPFEFTWARLFYLYGEGQPASSLLPQLRRAVERGEAEFKMSGGEQLRDYLDVAEAAKALVALAATGRGHGVVNVCSGVPTSVRRLVERWIAENGWTIRPAFGECPYAAYEPMAFWGDGQKLKQIIGASIPSAHML